MTARSEVLAAAVVAAANEPAAIVVLFSGLGASAEDGYAALGLLAGWESDPSGGWSHDADPDHVVVFRDGMWVAVNDRRSGGDALWDPVRVLRSSRRSRVRRAAGQ